VNDQSAESALPLSEPSCDLLARARAGDAEALTRLLEPYEEAVFRLAYRIAGHEQDAEDLAQDALIRIVRSLSGWRRDCSFRTWVYRVTLSVCLTARRKRREAPMDLRELALWDGEPGPEAEAIMKEFRQRIREEALGLPFAYREAVMLRLSEDLTYAEIADVLGVPLNTALTRVHRGMKRLRERLKPWIDEGRT
jgi:RNA polymerase sigma-70 factor, ECF subfamily